MTDNNQTEDKTPAGSGEAQQDVAQANDANGDRFVGEFRDKKRNGQGSLFGPDQRLLQNGIWRDDVLIQANNLPTPSY